MQLPEGWVYTPRVPASVCAECRQVTPERPGNLRSPSGREWPLIGNKSVAQERAMVRAIVEAHT